MPNVCKPMIACPINEIRQEKIIQIIISCFKGQKVMRLMKKSLNTHPMQNILQNTMSNSEERDG